VVVLALVFIVVLVLSAVDPRPTFITPAALDIKRTSAPGRRFSRTEGDPAACFSVLVVPIQPEGVRMFFKSKSNEGTAPAAPVLPDVAVEIAISPSLQAAVERVETLVAAHQQIEAAFATAEVGQEAAQRELRESTDRLATVESATALSGSDVDRGARKAHVAARDAVEFAQARVTGLEARLSQSAAAVADAKRLLAGKWTAWKNEQAEVALARFEQAISRFVREVKVVKGAATVLGHTGRLDSILRGLALPDPRKPYMDHATPARLKDWPDLPEARDVNTRLADVVARVMPLVRDIVEASIAVSTEEGDAA
jgi:hypothetical protein